MKRGEHAIGFQIAAYDRDHPLVIGPALEYSTYLGGAGGEEAGLALALDGDCEDGRMRDGAGGWG